MEAEVLNVISVPFVLFWLPDLVEITITPFEALEPYNAAAEEPFSTFIVAMSLGSRLEIPLEYAPPPCAWFVVVTWSLL